jgi:simple sugar transport system permease protein
MSAQALSLKPMSSMKATEMTSAESPTERLRSFFYMCRSHGNTGLLVLLGLLFLIFTILLPGRFATHDTLVSMMFQLPELGLLALAMLFPLLSGGFNLAIIATTNMAALLMAWIMVTYVDPTGGNAGLIVALALLAGLVTVILVGAFTGYLVATLNTHPILVTLGTMSIISGFCVWLTRGKPIAGFPESVQSLGNAIYLGIPLPFWIFTAATIAVSLLLSRTRFGISVYMVGSNLEATRYSGINTRNVLIGIYAASSVLCWCAAILMMARFNSASAGYATSYLLITVLAAILGGVDPNGGFGKVSGLFIALLVLQVISSGLNLLGVNTQLTQATWGGTMIMVMVVRYLIARFGWFKPRRKLAKSTV